MDIFWNCTFPGGSGGGGGEWRVVGRGTLEHSQLHWYFVIN